MILSDAITRVADDARVNSSIATVNSRIIREINRVCSDIWNGFRWTFRWRNFRIVTDVDQSTGTVTATNGSYSLMFSGTSFPNQMAGWHISFPQDNINNWYKIRLNTNTTQLEMDVPYTGITGSGKTYILRHFDYLLPSELWDLGSVIVTHDRRPLSILEPTSIEILGPVPYYKGYPLAVAIYSSNFGYLGGGGPNIESTGTVSGTINTQTLTGSGTAWLGMVYPGDVVMVGGNTYTVQSVDTNTQITLYQNLLANASNAAYTIELQLFGRFVRIMWPSTDNYTIDFRYLRLYQSLVNNNDTNELFFRMPQAIILKAAALELKANGDAMWQQADAQADLAIQKARAEDDALTPRDSVTGIFSYRRQRRRWYRDSLR